MLERVTESPPDPHVGPRRHRSRQRERILSWIRASESHPTAGEIHRGLLPELPALSLGTVYRNLEVLVADGEVYEVPGHVGASRYDGNPDPHHHFHCEHCGRILDLDVPVPRGLARRVVRDHGLHARRDRIAFFGLCPACEAETSRSVPDSRTHHSRQSRRQDDG